MFKWFKRKPDYTALTELERDKVRAILKDILILLMGKKYHKDKRAEEFMEIQRTAGEKYKTFYDKMVYLDAIHYELSL